MHLNLRWLAVLACFLLGLAAHAAPLAVGDLLPVFSARDQHGNEFNSTNRFRFMLAVTEMAAAKAANQKLAAMGAGYLETNSAVYVMDIHTMPGIARYFALPKMRKYPQPIVLVETAETLAAFPAQPGRVTVLTLTPGKRIQKITYWDPAADPTAVCFQ